MLQPARLPAAARRFAGSAALVLGLAGGPVWAGREFQVRGWHTEDGLPDGTITALAQTPDGLLWIGTRRGLVRFDGVSFLPPASEGEAGIRGRGIAGLAVDGAGRLWVACESGDVLCLAAGAFRALLPATNRTAAGRTGFPSYRPDVVADKAPPSRAAQWLWRPFQPLAADAGGAVWSVGEDGTLFHFAGNSVSNVLAGRLPEGRLSGLVSDTTGRLWIVKGGRIVALGRGDGEAHAIEGMGQDAPMVVCRAQTAGLWVAVPHEAWLRGGQVRRFTDEGWQPPGFPTPLAPGSLRSQVTALLEDAGGRLWLGMLWNGLFYRNPGGDWERVDTIGPLAQSLVSCLLEDREGAIWAGTVGEGLHRVVSLPVTMLLLPDEARESIVTTAFAAHDGSLWLGTDGHGLYHWAAGRFVHYGLGEGLPHEHVCAVLEDAATNLWVGTWSGLARRRGAGFSQVSGSPALGRPVLALFAGKSGTLWVGSQAGLLRGEGGTNWTLFAAPGAGEYVDIRCIAEDPAGRIWVAAIGSGLLELRGGALTRVNRWPALDRADVRCVHSDSDGILWVGTASGGLFRVEGADVRQYSVADGLPNDSVASLAEDAAGNLWMSSDNGVFGCSRRLLAEYARGASPALLCWRLTPAEGLASRACSGSGQPVAAQTPGGRLWFPDMRGVASFSPQVLTRGRSAPQVLLEQIVADGVALRRMAAGGYRAPADTRRFEFHYTAPDLSSAAALRFRHRLAGLDRDWVDAGSARVAGYSQLPAGDYEFQVMVGGASGKWHEAAQPLRLQVVPRFWQTAWFRGLGVALTIGAVAGGVALNERRKLRRRLERLEAQQALESERRRIAQDLHDDLGARLTEIVLLGELARRGSRVPEALLQQFGAVTQKVRQLITAMEEVVWTVNPRNDSVPNLAAYLCDYAERFLSSTEMNLRIDVSEDLPGRTMTAAARHHLLLALKEALNNAVRHSAAKEVRLRVAVEADALTVQVEDSGRGFDAAHPPRRGHGLESLRSRVESQGGRFRLRSEPGGGTTVAFTFPLEPEQTG